MRRIAGISTFPFCHKRVRIRVLGGDDGPGARGMKGIEHGGVNLPRRA